MAGILVRGLHRLEGEIRIQGSKNAVLPVMAASLLHRGTITLDNVPKIQDVFCMMGILESLGCACRWSEHTVTIDTTGQTGSDVPEDAAKKMRSSIMLIGPLLGTAGKASTWYPGGCSIGERPIDLHLLALRQMGAEVVCDGDCIAASASKLRGTEIHLAFPSVGATENVVMAAVAAEGVTVLRGAAREPEIEILCHFLETMGAKIEGIGSSVLKIHGGRPLHDTAFRIPGDRIVAGTYMGAVLAAGGRVWLREVPALHLTAVIDAAEQMGAEVACSPYGILVGMEQRPVGLDLKTRVYPGFPTDLQSVFVAAASVADGTSFISEHVFEGRFAAAKELRKLGGHIIIRDRTVCVDGVYPLTGGAVTAPDLRGGAALVVAGLAARGETLIEEDFHIQRGYEDICRDLRGVGADITFI